MRYSVQRVPRRAANLWRGHAVIVQLPRPPRTPTGHPGYRYMVTSRFYTRRAAEKAARRANTAVGQAH